MPLVARRYVSADRASVLALLGDARAIDSPSSRIHVVEQAGAVVGAVVWVRPDAGDEAYLGAVMAPAGRRDLFYALIAACAQDAIAQGFALARFDVRNERLLRRIERDFVVAPRVAGRSPTTGQALSWQVRVDLQDALAQLQRFL